MPSRDSSGGPSESSSEGSPLRIAFLNSWKNATHEGTGTAVGIANLQEGLTRLGHQVVLLSPSGNGLSGSGKSSGGNSPSENGAHGKNGAHGEKGGASLLYHRLRYNALLPKRVREHGSFDLVVGFDIDGVRCSGSPGRPRSNFILALKGIAGDEARFARGRDRILLRFLAHLERRSARGAGQVVVPSRYSAEVAIQAYGLNPQRVQVVPEGLELEPWWRMAADPPPPPENPTLLSVARQYPRKDTATLLRALPMVRRQVPDLRLRVVGGGPELPRLRTLARELGIMEAVTFEGALPDDDAVRRAYFQADLFCLPSRQEGFGIVFLEAMAAGLPVVAARAGAVPEVVEDGETGLLVPPGSPDALSAALLRLLADWALREKMGRAGRKRARAFSLESVAARFLEATGHAQRIGTPGALGPVTIQDR